MGQKLVPASVVLGLVVATLMLPVAISILLGLSRLLSAMGDSSGGTVLNWIALAAGILWILDLVGLILVQAINSLGSEVRPGRQDRDE